jgi:hypothetical protein
VILENHFVMRCDRLLNLKKLSTNSCMKTCEKFEKHNHGENKYECGKVKELALFSGIC